MHNGKHLILVIDDDPDVVDVVRMVVEKHGYAMVSAPSAEEGLQKYRESKPDLVIVDLMMEEVDSGTSFVKELKLLGNRAPVYMLSSVGDSLSTMTDYSGLGLTGIFQKPIDSTTLLATLRAKLK